MGIIKKCKKNEKLKEKDKKNGNYSAYPKSVD